MMAKQGVKFTLKGDKAMERRFRRVAKAISTGNRAALIKTLWIEAEAIMARSKTLVPVDTGALRNSGNVLPPILAPGIVTIEMGYGDSAVDYAVPVHEILHYYHPIGQAKYLEIPFTQALALIQRRVALPIFGMMNV